MTKKPDHTRMNGKASGKWPWILIVMVLSLVSISYFVVENPYDTLKDIGEPIVEEQERNRIRQKIERETRVILRETDQRNRDAYETAMTELNGINIAVDRAEEGVAPVVDELTSFKGCAILCYLIVKDKFSGTCETEERIQSVIDAHIGQNILHVAQQRETAVARLNDALARNATDMQVRLASMAESILVTEDDTVRAEFRDLLERIAAVSQGFDEIAVNTIVSGAGLAISALLVKTTVKQARNVLSHIARRLGQTTALALGSAAADGPFPIGDVIGLVIEVGGAAYLLYELYDAQFILRDRVAGDLRRALAQYRGDTLDHGEKQSLELLKAYHNRNLKTAQNMINQFS